ncbi:YraN family protein [Nocardioides yefusunii]|uniref:UPF0102 protein ACFPWU_06995 n=1 Tax=Nocardioides yefusunii TaxID=2500546 RepID=A0ABW1QVV0_9ACTN|nr:YraN family protein [Nocardioides yefusunii]
MTSNRTTHNARLGRWGEEVARRHLLRAGMTLLDQNWRGPSGEVDLVLRDGAEVVVCEVKTRTSSLRGTPHEAVDETKAARLRLLAAEWVQAHPEAGADPGAVRVDLVAVLRPRGAAPRLEHVRGIC